MINKINQGGQMDAYAIVDNDRVLDSKSYVLRVKELDDRDKPREKMVALGPGVLSVGELLAILLNTGTKKEEVLAMSKRVLKEYGERAIITQKNPETLSEELNIPFVKACQIVACFELGSRFFSHEAGRPVYVRNAKQAFRYFMDMSELKKEHLRGIYLNSQYQVVHDEVISIGTLTSSIVHPREVFAPALRHYAVAVILAHNHPSGGAKPTKSDLMVTSQLIQSGAILGVEVLDHLIISKNKHFSLIKEGAVYEGK